MAAKQIPIGNFGTIPLSILDEAPHQPLTASRMEKGVLEAYSEQVNPASLDRAFVLHIG